MLFAIHKLGDALSELIGHELELAEQVEGSGFVEAEEGWSEGAEEAGWSKTWREKGMEAVNEVKATFTQQFRNEYVRLMGEVRLNFSFSPSRFVPVPSALTVCTHRASLQRFGFTSAGEGHFELFTTFLDLLEAHELDFTSSFRLLSQFTSTTAPSFSRLLDVLLPSASSSSSNARTDWTAFFKNYEELLSKDPGDASTRRKRMDAVNPRFSLRQWVLEETIKKVDKDGEEGVKQLERVLALAQSPFEAYGEPDVEGGEIEGVCPTPEEQERKRLSGTGPKDLLGFQCSCSS